MARERIVRTAVWTAVLVGAAVVALVVVGQDVGDDARAWNDLTLLSGRPTAAEIEAHKCTAPAEEKQRASRAVAAALVKEAVPEGLADHLLALGSDWLFPHRAGEKDPTGDLIGHLMEMECAPECEV